MMSAPEKRSLEEFTSALGDRLNGIVAKQTDVGDNVLHHYTTPPGFEAILRSERFWATHVRFLNDWSEQKYAMELINEAMKRWMEKVPLLSPHHVNGYLKQLLEFCRDLWKRHEAFVVCFCEKENLLNQWRVYAGTEGFSMGFNGKQLAEAGQKPNPWNGGRTFSLMKVVYHRDEQKRLVEAVIDAVADELGKVTPSMPIVLHAADAAATKLAMLSITFKDPAFEAEQEWRLWAEVPNSVLKPKNAKRGETHVRCRTTPKGLVPYVELDPTIDKKLPISEVWHGPSLRAESVEFATKRLLAQWDYEHVPIKGSKIPLVP